MNNTNLLQQLFLRLTSKSPRLFIYLQWAGLIATGIAQLPLLLSQFGVNISIVDQPWKGILTIAGITTILISKLPVSSDSTKADQVNSK